MKINKINKFFLFTLLTLSTLSVNLFSMNKVPESFRLKCCGETKTLSFNKDGYEAFQTFSAITPIFDDERFNQDKDGENGNVPHSQDISSLLINLIPGKDLESKKAQLKEETTLYFSLIETIIQTKMECTKGTDIQKIYAILNREVVSDSDDESVWELNSIKLIVLADLIGADEALMNLLYEWCFEQQFFPKEIRELPDYTNKTMVEIRESLPNLEDAEKRLFKKLFKRVIVEKYKKETIFRNQLCINPTIIEKFKVKQYEKIQIKI